MKLKTKHAAACALIMSIAAAALAAHPAAASAAETPDLDAYADAVVSLVNAERASAGLSPVQAVPALNDAAEVRSSEIVRSFSHTRPDGRSCSTILDDSNIQWRTTGENIAYGYATPEAVMEGWMNSSGHRANILNGNYDYIGVGVVYEGGTLYWTQVFTGGVELSGAYLPDGTVTVPETPTEAPSAPVQPSTPEETNAPSWIPEISFTGTNCNIGDVCPVIFCPSGNVNGSDCTSITDVIGLQKYLSGNCSLSDLNANCGNIGNLLNGSNCNISTLMGLLTCNK